MSEEVIADVGAAPVAGRVALGVEYNGSAYFGWQRQQGAASVQECLEKALSRVANTPIVVFSIRERGNFLKVLKGQGVFTTIA